MKRGIRSEQTELVALIVLISCIGFFIVFFLSFYLFFDKKSVSALSSQAIQPVFISKLNLTDLATSTNQKKNVDENKTTKKEAQTLIDTEASNQSAGNETQAKKSELPSRAISSEDTPQRSASLHPDYRNQRIARQSHESRLATQNRAMQDALAQQELQNLILRLPESDTYECIQANNGVKCAPGDLSGKYLEGLLYRAWGNPSCDVVSIGKRIGIAYGRCLPN